MKNNLMIAFLAITASAYLHAETNTPRGDEEHYEIEPRNNKYSRNPDKYSSGGSSGLTIDGDQPDIYSSGGSSGYSLPIEE